MDFRYKYFQWLIGLLFFEAFAASKSPTSVRAVNQKFIVSD